MSKTSSLFITYIKFFFSNYLFFATELKIASTPGLIKGYDNTHGKDLSILLKFSQQYVQVSEKVLITNQWFYFFFF